MTSTRIQVNRKAALCGLPVVFGLLIVATYQATVSLALAVGLGLVLEVLVWRPWPWERRSS
jgi:hypothetical protein